METIVLDVTESVYPSAKAARQAGRIPMAYYGKGFKNHSFSVDYQNFRRVFQKGGRSTIVDLTNEKKEVFPALVQEIQFDPVSDRMIHIDLIAVDMNKPIRTSIPIVLIGVSPAVKDLGGILVQNKNDVEIECLPKDLIHQIEVDISPIVDFHSSILLGDIQVPPAIKILDAKNINVATVTAPRAEETYQPQAAAATTETAAAEGGPAAEGEKKEEEKK